MSHVHPSEPPPSTRQSSIPVQEMLRSARVALLTNFIPPYRVPVFREIMKGVGDFRVFISTPMERNRQWPVSWSDLPVTQQRTWTLATRRWRNVQFNEEVYIHFPYSTISNLSAFKPQAVISAELGLRTAQAMLYCRSHPNTAFIPWVSLSEHTESQANRPITTIRRRLLRSADSVITNGASATRYINSLGVAMTDIFEGTFCVDMAPYRRLPIDKPPEAARRLIYAGRLIPLKGLLEFVTALETYCRTNSSDQIQMWFAGDGPLRTTLASRALPANLTFRFFGHVDHERLPSLYEQCGIFVFPTFTDTWGMVINEAMASGLAILGSTYSQAVGQLVESRRTGWRFATDDVESLRMALLEALRTPLPALRAMQVSARESIAYLTPAYSGARMLDAVAHGIARRT